MPERRKHPQAEVSASYRSQKIIQRWIKDTVTPSNLVIREIHKALLGGSPEYARKGLTPNAPGNYRIEDLTLSNREPNHLVRGLDVEPAMLLYTAQLDKILKSLPSSPLGFVDEVIQKGAWAYFVFERIHPFLDGNGRTGRMILKRILGAAGFRDLLFHDQSWQNRQGSNHIRALERVDETGNLLSLEMYLLETLLPRYSPEKDSEIYTEMSDLVNSKKERLKKQKGGLDISSIWLPFRDLLAP